MGFYKGLMVLGEKNLKQALAKAKENCFDCLVAPIHITGLPFDHDNEQYEKRSTELLCGDPIGNPDQWTTETIPMISDDLDCDNEDPKIRQDAERQLRSELEWCVFLQNAGYAMVTLKSAHMMNFARIATENIRLAAILVRVPLYMPRAQSSNFRRDLKEDECWQLVQDNNVECDTWHWWHRFRSAADYNYRLRLVLEFDVDNMPSFNQVRRWLGEPIECILIPSSMFTMNKHNYPVVNKKWHEILGLFLNLNVNIIVSASPGDRITKRYLEFLLPLREAHKDESRLMLHQNVIQHPLQPLYDNLDSHTYEIFEKDPAKYKLYQTAIEQALLDRVPHKQIKKSLTIIMVLGAGRGPLVRAALNASKKTGRRVRVYIVDKNPNAIRTLQAMTKTIWRKYDVRLFSKDMRVFNPPEKADILVSELLGSFGDNELSPECLDCASNLIKQDGISIPCKSTSYINPVMSSVIYNNIRKQTHGDRMERVEPALYASDAENWYVVLLKSAYHIDRPKPLFEFYHPNRDERVDNSRWKTLRFEASMDCVLHGFAGYFDAQLYKDIKISIHPEEHTMGMFSWFPMYFPLTNPQDIKEGQAIEVNFWRCLSNQKVWYEWNLTEPLLTHIHNHGGRNGKIFKA